MIRDNYLSIQKKIAETAIACGRNPEGIKLLTVTKQATLEQLTALYELGQRDFGENRVQALLEKQAAAPKDCRWHLIGTLQSNKVNKSLGHVNLIHSVDTPELAKKIAQCSQDKGMVSSILLQVNTSGEISKHGLSLENWKRHFENVFNLPNLLIKGFMTMAPLTQDEKLIRLCFQRLRLMRDEIMADFPKAKELSMGMSNDFTLAIEEGATIIRIGSALL